MTKTITTGAMRQRHYTRKRNGHGLEAVTPMGDRRVVLYARISKDREDETSTASQLREMEAYCTTRGWVVVGRFVEAGESAFNGKAPRAEFAKALSMVRTGQANTLMAWKLDRFMRDASTAMRVRDEIHAWGGSVVCSSEGVDTADGSSTAGLIFGILAWLAEQESKTKSDRTTSWHVSRLDDGTGKALPPTGRTPYGYARHNGELHVMEHEAGIIREAAALIIGGMPLKTTADKLNREGKAGRTFSIGGLKYVLTAETTAGLRYDGSKHHVGNWEPILDRKTWEQVCTILHDPSRRTNMTDGKGRAYIMVGLMECGKCRGPMKAQKHSTGMRYLCKDSHCGLGIKMDVVDNAITAWILHNVDEDAWEAMRLMGRGQDPKVLDSMKAKLKKVTALYVADEMDEDEYQEARDAINAKLDAATSSTFMELPNVASLRDGWRDLDVDAKRLAIKAVFKSVTIVPHVDGMEMVDRIVVDPR